MLIPITLLWGVQMRLTKKLTLAVIFSLVVITIIIATIRIIAITSSGLVDPSWAFFWSIIEAQVGTKANHLLCKLSVLFVSRVNKAYFDTALIISCVANSRSLFTNRERRVKYTPPDTEQQMQADRRERRPRDPYPLTEFITNISDLGTQASGRDLEEGSFSQTDRSSDNGIRVEHEADIVHENP